MRVSEFLQRFELNIKYKFGKTNIVLNIFLRFEAYRNPAKLITVDNESKLNTLYISIKNRLKVNKFIKHAYTCLLVKMSEKFK